MLKPVFKDKMGNGTEGLDILAEHFEKVMEVRVLYWRYPFCLYARHSISQKESLCLRRFPAIVSYLQAAS